MKNHTECTGHCECGMVSGEIGEYCRHCDRKISSCDGRSPFCG